jgi:hypothetical protein
LVQLVQMVQLESFSQAGLIELNQLNQLNQQKNRYLEKFIFFTEIVEELNLKITDSIGVKKCSLVY